MEGRTCIVCGSEVMGWLSFTVVLLWNVERFGSSCADVQDNQQLPVILAIIIMRKQQHYPF